MFIDPSKSGLILIGASEFSNDERLNRPCLKNARDKVEEYFLNENVGLNIPGDNVLDLFDSDELAQKQTSTVREFCPERGGFENLFVYIVTHGVNPDPEKSRDPAWFHPYRLKVRQTEFDGGVPCDNTVIKFEYLYNAAVRTCSERIFFILDACYSGAVHTVQAEAPILPAPRHPSGKTEHGEKSENPLPQVPLDSKAESTGSSYRRCATILTSNSTREIDTVRGNDDDGLPLFTHWLLTELHEGRGIDFRYGLSFSALGHLINQRAKNDNRAEKGNVAMVSNRDIGFHGSRLSEFPIFPNNHCTHVAMNNAALHVRISWREAGAEKAKREEFEARNQKLLEERIELERRLDEANQAIIGLTEEKGGLTAVSDEIKRTNTRQFRALVIAVLLLAVCVALLGQTFGIWHVLVEKLAQQ